MIKLVKELFFLIPKRQQVYLFILQILIIFNATLEMVSVFSIIPFFTAVTDYQSVLSNQYFQWMISYFKLQNQVEVITFLGLLTILVYSISIIISLLSSLLFSLFGEYNSYFYTTNFYKYYLTKSLLYHKDTSSGLMIKNLSFEINKISSGILLPALRANSKIISSLFIIVLIVIISPQVAISSIIILSALYLFIYKLIKNKAYKIGETITNIQEKRYSVYSETFLAIKDILFKKNQYFYTNQVDNLNRGIIKANSFSALINQAPRVLVDLILFNAVILAIIIFIKKDGNNFNEIITTIALFGFASYRLIPSFQQIFISAATIKANLNAFLILKKEIKDINFMYNSKKKYNNFSIKKYIKLNKISFKYPSSSTNCLSNISLNLELGKKYAIVGSSGSGKTTLLDLILGLINPTNGELYYDNKKSSKKFHNTNKLNISYVSQNIYLSNSSIKENILFGNEDKFNNDLFKKSITSSLVEDFAIKTRKKYNSIVGERGEKLSGGQRQRVGIARALYHNSNIIVFDEATSALDNITESKIYKNIDKNFKNKTMIVVTHRLQTIKNFDEIFVLDNGKLIGQGDYKFLNKKNKYFKELINAHE